MSLEAIKSEMAEMPREQQDQLAAYLVHLRHQRNPNAADELTRRMGDKDPKNWISLNELKQNRDSLHD